MKKKRIPKFYYVYLITNLETKKQYVGSKVCYGDNPNNDNYWGSSEYLSKDILEYGIENFKKEIIRADYKNYDDLLNGETFYILEYDTLFPNGYNRFIPNERKGFNSFGISNYEVWEMKYGEEEANKRYKKWKEKERLAQTGEKNPFYGKKHTEKTKEQISKKQKVRLKNGDYSEAYRKAGQTIKERGSLNGEKNGMYGKVWVFKETVNKCVDSKLLNKYLSEGWIKGMYVSEEIKAKQKTAQLNRNYKTSNATKQKLSIASSGSKNGNAYYFLITTPVNEYFLCHGNVQKFCDEYKTNRYSKKLKKLGWVFIKTKTINNIDISKYKIYE